MNTKSLIIHFLTYLFNNSNWVKKTQQHFKFCIILVSLFLISITQSTSQELWGTTMMGGASSMGVIFKYDYTTNTYSKKVDFDGTVNGSYPYAGSIMADNGKLYGMSSLGGASNVGAIYEYDPATNTFIRKVSFTYGNGREPQGKLLLASNGKIYGMTGLGSANNQGVVFEYTPGTNSTTTKVTFDGANKGANPYGSLMQAANGKLYGFTHNGGTSSLGVLFEYNYATNTYTKKVDFDGANKGSNPNGTLVQASNGMLYGMTKAGGANGYGVIFEYDYTTNTFTKKIDFDGSTKGSNPWGSLIEASNGKLYGLTRSGGANNGGVLFEFDPSTGTFAKKVDFNSYAKGSVPSGSLFQASNGKLYGMTNSGGVNSSGVIFEYNPSTNTFTKKYDLLSTNGSSPWSADLIEICAPITSAPTAGTHIASQNQIVWKWNSLPEAISYKWNTTNDYNTAVNIGEAITKTETGLSYNTEYTRYIWGYNSCSISDVTILTQTTTSPPGLWKGNSTDWNTATNWSDGNVPTSSVDVIIPTNPSGGQVFPVINITNAVCKNLTIAAGGSLNVTSGNILTLYGNMNNSGSSLLGNGTVSFNGASAQTISGTNTFSNLKINNSNGVSLSGNTEITGILTTTTGTLTTNNNLILNSTATKNAIISGTGTGSISGNVTINRYLGASGGYHYVATPLQTSTFNDITDNITITGFGRTYKNGGWSNVWKYNETDISQIDHPYGVMMNGWEAPASANENISPMEGFAVYTTSALTIDFTGTANNGSIGIAVTNTSSVASGGELNDDGWNFVGNSYPCAIDWDASGGWTKTNVDNAIYMYEPSGTKGGAYKSYVNGIGNPSGVTGLIAPMQGFFVHANANGTLGMNNNVRIDNTSVHFNKKSEDRQLVKIAVYNVLTPAITDETTLYFDENATMKFDSQFDAYKMMNNDDEIPNLYTRSADNMNLSINGLNSPDAEETTVPLVINVKKDGEYVLWVAEISNLPAETNVYIIDTEKNVSLLLNENPEYTVSLAAGNNDNRFYLKFVKKATGIEKQNENNIFYTYLSGKTLNLAYNNSSNTSATLNIYNILGQQAVNSKQITNGNYQYDLSNGTYIVRLISDNKTYIKKLLVK